MKITLCLCLCTHLSLLYLPFNWFLVLSVHISKIKLDCKENVGYRDHVKFLILNLTLKHKNSGFLSSRNSLGSEITLCLNAKELKYTEEMRVLKVCLLAWPFHMYCEVRNGKQSLGLPSTGANSKMIAARAKEKC